MIYIIFEQFSSEIYKNLTFTYTSNNNHTKTQGAQRKKLFLFDFYFFVISVALCEEQSFFGYFLCALCVFAVNYAFGFVHNFLENLSLLC